MSTQPITAERTRIVESGLRADMPREAHACAPTPRNEMSNAPLCVALVISNLEYGGAQRQVAALANWLNANGHQGHIVSLSDYVPLAADLTARDRLHVVAKRGKFDFSVVSRLAELLTRIDADVVHAFLFDAEIAARLAGRRYRRAAVIGSERNTDYHLKLRHAAALRITGRWFDGIIANSNAGRRFQARRLGISEDRLFVVHNGIDTQRFCPGNGAAARRELGLPADVPVIGMFASFKEQKNHAMFFRAARRVLAARPEARFICVGDALHAGLQASDAYRDRMQAMVDSEGLSRAITFVGNRDDVAPLYRACTLTALTSRREGTPNVLLESMACGVPVIATDIADNAMIVPNEQGGYIVPLDDDATMAEHMLALMGDDARRTTFGAEGRRWVEREYTVARMAEKTLRVYRTLLQRRTR